MEHNEYLEIQNRYVSELKTKDEFVKTHPDFFIDEDKLRRVIFSTKAGLQITKFGFIILSNNFQIHQYTTSLYLTARHLIKLSKFFKYPFYMKGMEIFLFCDEEQAFFINLCGELEQFLENLNS